MVLQANEFKIENDGIWISKNAIEELRQYYKSVVSNTVPYDMYYVGKADVLADILKHFEPLEP